MFFCVGIAYVKNILYLCSTIKKARNMNIVYTNKHGESYISNNVEKFDIRGTIMTAAIKKVGDMINHRLYVEDGKGGYAITIWSSANGYDANALRVGRVVRFRGTMHKQHYMGSDGTAKYFKDYKAYEMFA